MMRLRGAMMARLVPKLSQGFLMKVRTGRATPVASRHAAELNGAHVQANGSDLDGGIASADLVQLLADLPNNVDRRTGAALVTKHLSRYPIAPLRLGLCRHATSTAKPSWRPAHCSSMPSPCCRPPRSSSVVAGPSALGSVARRPPNATPPFTGGTEAQGVAL